MPEPGEQFKEVWTNASPQIRDILNRIARLKEASANRPTGYLPGMEPKGAESTTPMCGDCLVPMKRTPILRRNTPPKFTYKCPSCGA